jgi:ATP-dependent 26S proteasome regulatory subunit
MGFRNFAPPKEIMKTEFELELKKNKINSSNKSIDTLYLRKRQRERLLNVLSKYRDDKDLYARLELPRKLGFLLYGKPGTGKSTTIKAIGSYLAKDVYYVDLGCITKNAELKMVFDFIHNNCNNGIIVFEDIDAMTHIVKNRHLDESRYNLSNVMKQEEDELSLAYFLNLLDGTLCKEDTIFIMTTNNKEILDPAIYRKGRVDVDIEMKSCDHFQIAEIYKSVKQKELSKYILLRGQF